MHNIARTMKSIAVAFGAGLGLWGATMPAMAETAPDSFRDKVIGASVVCYGVFSRLAVETWPDRDNAEVYELQEDARQKRDFTLDWLTRYTAGLDDFDLNAELANGNAVSGSQTMSKSDLLDLGIYCENQIFALIDEEESNGYTP